MNMPGNHAKLSVKILAIWCLSSIRGLHRLGFGGAFLAKPDGEDNN